MKRYFDKRKLVIFFLFLSIITSTFLPIDYPSLNNPTFSVQRAEALGLPTWDIPDWVKKLLDAIAMAMAQVMVDNIVQSTVRWANNGFDGNPAYVNDPAQFFTDVADGAFGEFVMGSDLEFMCSPFKDVVRVSLRNQYYQPTGGGETGPFQCTFSEIAGNLDDFYESFNQGGWDGWFSATQDSRNNPYGSYLSAQIELNHRLASEVGLKKDEFNINQGFLSLKSCAEKNPTQAEIDDYEKGTYKPGSPGYDIAIGVIGYNPSKGPGECIREGGVKTAGTMIKGQLDNVLPSGLNKLISVQHIEQLVGAFASGLLERYVFSDKGFFGDTSVTARRNELMDVPDKDGKLDGVPDGYDTDGDGQLDICHHGLRYPDLPPSNELDPPTKQSSTPSNTNCLLSHEVKTSPFFIPICEGSNDVIRPVENFLTFVRQNHFEKTYANTWLNRMTSVQGRLEEFTKLLMRYEVQEYDKPMFNIGQYTKWLEESITSLAKDGDLAGGSRWRGSYVSDNERYLQMIRNTTNILNYLKAFSAEVSKNCEDPDTGALNNIPDPEVIPNPQPGEELIPPEPEPGWILCAPEGDYCVYEGTKEIRYGANGVYAFGTFADSVLCSNEIFGDPIVDVVKWCSYRDDIVTDPTPNPNPETPPPPDGTTPQEPV
jgi:hypothetical protein